MTEIPFRGAMLKLERAKHHINDLNAKIGAFFDGYSIAVFDNAETCERSVFLKADKPIPAEFSVIIGDAVHNLRTTLDHMTYEIISPYGPPNPDQVQFPFAPNEKALKSALAQRQIHLAGKDIVTKFRELKPYPGGNDLLHGLHKLDIFDKHALIFSIVGVLGLNALDLQQLGPDAPIAPNEVAPTLFYPAENQHLVTWRYDPTDP